MEYFMILASVQLCMDSSGAVIESRRSTSVVILIVEGVSFVCCSVAAPELLFASSSN